MPFLTATKPFNLRMARAFWTALVHWPRPFAANFFLAAAFAFLLTILPRLLTIKSLAVRPLAVFSLVPRRTTHSALEPLAILLTRLAFMTFIAFMAFMTFMAFIAFAIAGKRRMESEDKAEICLAP